MFNLSFAQCFFAPLLKHSDKKCKICVYTQTNTIFLIVYVDTNEYFSFFQQDSLENQEIGNYILSKYKMKSKIVDEINTKIFKKCTETNHSLYVFISTLHLSNVDYHYIGFINKYTKKFDLFGKIIGKNVVYVGEFVDGKKHGYGCEKFFDETFKRVVYEYNGYWKDDNFSFGRFANQYKIYFGSFKNGKFDGYGEIVNFSKSFQLNGFWQDSKISKFFTIKDCHVLIHFSWTRFVNMKCEKKYIISDYFIEKHFEPFPTKHYVGMYNDFSGKFDGYGVYFVKSKLRYIGEWSNGKRNGNGILFNKKGQFCYCGEFYNNLYNGYGCEYYNGFWYLGKFLYNYKHGHGKLYKNNKLIKEGIWSFNNYVGKII